MSETATVTKMRPKRTKRGAGRPVTDDQKQKMADGRVMSAAVRRYLDALEAEMNGKRRGGRRRTPEQVQARLMEVSSRLEAATNSLQRLQLTQQQGNLEDELEALVSKPEAVDIAPLEKEFVKHAAGYASSKHITHSTFRKMGVPASVLREAGITR